jgi:hypothetical protein
VIMQNSLFTIPGIQEKATRAKSVGVVKSPEHSARRFDWKLVPECAIKRNGQIDALVYNLYALTSAEIKIVEGAAS